MLNFSTRRCATASRSLWGMRMRAGMALPVSPIIDRTGFRVIDLAGSSMMEVLIRHCRENRGKDWTAGAVDAAHADPRGMRSNASVTFGRDAGFADGCLDAGNSTATAFVLSDL